MTVLKLIECEGILYRGTKLEQPEEVWHYSQKKWVPHQQRPLPNGASKWIEEEVAETLKQNNAAAEHFLYYDTAPWSQGCEPFLDLPDYLKARIAEWEAERASGTADEPNA